ncbi:hypothetical protein [Actinophytocola glycyrrhizae]|uniref:PE family protein n=1 Tax=Actinophytocola glycyrrhizae TaxID=2044873 RepID=A0ABV9RZ52_9PSEU
MPGQEASEPDRPSWYMPYGASGGGGADGQYVFTDLDELDGIITELEEIAVEVRDDLWYYDQAIGLATPPAEDVMSRGQVAAYIASLEAGREHNKAMLGYAENQLAKLQAARHTYAENDSGAAARLRHIEGDR